MAMPHHIYTIAHIYITFILLSISSFILLPLLWAGRLAQTLLVWHSNDMKAFLFLPGVRGADGNLDVLGLEPGEERPQVPGQFYLN
jgi:hypothetical protein